MKLIYFSQKAATCCITFFIAVTLLKTCNAETIAEPTSAKTISFTLSVKNATVQETVAALARMSGRNIIADPKITEPVTLHLEKVTLATALDILTTAQGLTYVEKDGVILVTREDTLKKQAACFFTFPLNYAKAEDLQKSLEKSKKHCKLWTEPLSW